MTKQSFSWLLALCLSVVSVQAFAQSKSRMVSKAELVSKDLFPGETSSDRTYIGNMETCRTMIKENAPLVFKWTFISSFEDESAKYALKAQGPEQTCSKDSPDESDDGSCTVLKKATAIGSQESLQLDGKARDIFGIDSPDQCENLDEKTTILLVLPYVPTSILDESDKTHEPDEMILQLKTKRPSAPTGVVASAGSASIFVEWSGASSSSGYVVYVSAEPLEKGATPETLSGVTRYPVSMSTSLRVTEGVQGGDAYYLAVTNRDSAGNESLLSDSVSVSMQDTVDFWEDYLNHDGREEGGYCTSMPSNQGAFLAILMSIGLLWRRSSTRRTGYDA